MKNKLTDLNDHLFAQIERNALASIPTPIAGRAEALEDRKARNLRSNTISQLKDHANSLSCGDWTAMDLEDNEVSHTLANIMRRAADLLALSSAPTPQPETVDDEAVARVTAKFPDLSKHDVKAIFDAAFPQRPEE